MQFSRFAGMGGSTRSRLYDEAVVQAHARRTLLETRMLSRLSEPVRPSPTIRESMDIVVQAIREQGLKDWSPNDAIACTSRASGPGVAQDACQSRAGVRHWRVHTDSEEGDRLMYVARTRNGFTPSTRNELFERLRGPETSACRFANLPEAKNGRWGHGFTRAKMAECRWVQPVLAGQFEVVEWIHADATALVFGAFELPSVVWTRIAITNSARKIKPRQPSIAKPARTRQYAPSPWPQAADQRRGRRVRVPSGHR
jgi:hypothetical protein